MRDIDALGAQVEACAQRYAPLTEVVGIAALTAGTLAGILGSHAPFATDAQLAAFAGVAPLEASSAGRGRHRLNRGGNRRLNAIIYRIAIAQLRHPGQARTYVDKKLALGHSKKEAIRSLKRYIRPRHLARTEALHASSLASNILPLSIGASRAG